MKVLIFGGSGLVGSKFIETYGKSFELKAPLVTEIDILDKSQVLKVAQDFNPDTIINFAAYTAVEEAEKQKGKKDSICYLINAIGAKNVADVCKLLDKHLIHISTEYVFDGTKSESPYTEEDKPNPINWYGQTKYFGEEFVLGSGCDLSLVRISMPFSPFYELKKDVGRFFLERLKEGSEITAIDDQKITPTLVSDIANALKILVDLKQTGIFHVCSKTSTTPFEFAKLIADTFGLQSFLVKPVSLEEYNKGKLAKMLKYSWLSPAKFENVFGNNILHTVQEAVRLFRKEM